METHIYMEMDDFSLKLHFITIMLEFTKILLCVRIIEITHTDKMLMYAKAKQFD